MIVSHRHRFIFLKTRKTAGTSVEISISRFCGPEDVITPITPVDEETRAQLGIAPQHHSLPLPVHRWRAREVRAMLRSHTRPQRHLFRSHSTAADAIEQLPPGVWDSYFTFCFVRNPWDYVASRHAWEVYRRKDTSLTVDDVLAQWDPAQNWLSYTIDGQVAVDFVGRFEQLEADLTAALHKVGLHHDGWLPRAKSGTGRRSHYRELLTPTQADFIAERCAPEIERFGYRF